MRLNCWKVSLVTNSKKLFDLKSPLSEDLTKIVHVIRFSLQNEESANFLQVPLTVAESVTVYIFKQNIVCLWTLQTDPDSANFVADCA